jgi:pimeloyl-ACP methyl ester carboxylesterase
MFRVPSTDEITITVHELGGEGPTLLFAHATGLHGRCWAPVASRLPGFRCLAPDLRGHGDSPVAPGQDFEWNGFADDVLAVVNALDEGSILAAGHSKGGAALLLAEERRPGTFRSLWCFEPVVFPGPPPFEGPNPMAEGARRRKETFSSFEEAFENYRSKPPFDELAEEGLRAYVEGGFAEQPDGTVRLKCEPEHEARVYEMAARSDAYDHLHLIHCPVVVARGRLEPGPSTFAEAIVERLPAGQLETFDDLGHFAPLEDPERIAGAISAAFSRA